MKTRLYHPGNDLDNPDGRLGTLGIFAVYNDYSSVPELSVVPDRSLGGETVFEVELEPAVTNSQVVFLVGNTETFTMPATANRPCYTRIIIRKIYGDDYLIVETNAAVARKNGDTLVNNATSRGIVRNRWTDFEGFEMAPELQTFRSLMALTLIMPGGSSPTKARFVLQFVGHVEEGDVPAYVTETETVRVAVPEFGFNVHELANPGILPIPRPHILDRAKQFGATWVRGGADILAGLTYDIADPVPDFDSDTATQSYIEELRERQLKLIMGIGWPIKAAGYEDYNWANSSWDHHNYLAEWVAAMCESWGSEGDVLKAVHFLNEPNLDLFYNFGYHLGWGFDWQEIDPLKVIDCAKKIYTAVKDVNPNIKVLGGDLAMAESTVPGIGGYIAADEWYETMLDNDMADYMDGLSIHPYTVGARTGSGGPSGDPLAPGSGWYRAINLVRDVNIVRDLDIPFWITETGYSTPFIFGVDLSPNSSHYKKFAQIQTRTVGMLRGIASRQPDVEGPVIIHGLADSTVWANYDAPSDRWLEGSEIIGA